MEKWSVDSARLLDVSNLRTTFFTPFGEVQAVNGISYHVNRQEIVAIVGESGCGKSVSQLSVLQLIPDPPGKIVDGKILFNGMNLLDYGANSSEMRQIRGAEISMIFQEPMTSLNPVLTIGSQISEVIRIHMKTDRNVAWQMGAYSLERVGIPDAAHRMKNYPFQLSGGMRQRVMIATAIACRSKLIIADEPTTALDVTTQAQVMELLLSVVRELKTSLVIVTHNLGLVTRYAERIYVMYAGKIIESGTTEDLMTAPRHPYTIGLLESVPRLQEVKDEDLNPIKGAPPKLINLPTACSFLPRCPFAVDECRQKSFPDLRLVGENQHFIACHLDLWRTDNE
jgi:oligopeptide/dipeptide ABC transporter ATP-binding protein